MENFNFGVVTDEINHCALLDPKLTRTLVTRMYPKVQPSASLGLGPRTIIL